MTSVHTPNSRYGGLSDEEPEFTDAEIAELVHSTSYRRASASIGWTIGRLQRAVKRHDEALEAEAQRAREAYEAEQAAQGVLLPTTDAEDDADADDTPDIEEQDPLVLKDGQRITVETQTARAGSLFLKASVGKLPVTLVSAHEFDEAITWATAPNRERAFVIDDPAGGRGFNVLPVFRANVSEEKREEEDERRNTLRRWMAAEFHGYREQVFIRERVGKKWTERPELDDDGNPTFVNKSMLLSFGLDTPEDRTPYERAIPVAGTAFMCLALIGHHWTPDILKRQARVFYYDARTQGRLPGQTRATNEDPRVKLDEYTVTL